MLQRRRLMQMTGVCRLPGWSGIALGLDPFCFAVLLEDSNGSLGSACQPFLWSSQG